MSGPTSDGDALAKVAKRYQRFAQYEAHGVSPTYERWALAVADDVGVRTFLAELPVEKQQPNLLFAAVRLLFPEVTDTSVFLSTVRNHAPRVRSLMLTRRVQTNEPARCATLLPVLARLPQPLALIEVGAAAGLCLIPDRYNYDFGRRRLESGSAGAPTFACDVNETAIPPGMPTIVWRAGLDLEPVDLRDDDAVAWLDALVWPEHRARAERLAAAIRLAAGEPPPVHRGDLLRDLDELVAKAPPHATVVVFHSAVLGYLPSRDAIAAFTQHVQRLPVRWLSNESPLANPDLAGDETVARAGSRFLLMLDGRPIAFTGPHGQSFELVGELPEHEALWSGAGR